MKEGKYLCASKLVIWGWKEIGKWDIPKEHYRVDENCTDLHVVELKTSSLCLSLSPSLFLLFCFFFLSFPPGCSRIQLLYTISLYHRFIALLSQMYRRLSDYPKVTGCIFPQPQGRGGLLIRTHWMWIFQKMCLQKHGRTGRLLGVLFFFFQPDDLKCFLL